MSSIDDRTVKMEFDNAEFKRKALETKGALSDVNKALDSTGKNKGLLNIADQAQRVGLRVKASTIIIGTAIANLTNKFVNSAFSMVKSFTFDPVRQGFHDYEENLTTLNTLMNATGLSSRRVQRVLNDLNHYSDKTIYSFQDMTGTLKDFVNQGVKIGMAQEAVKGIANAAAFAGSDATKAQSAFWAFGQALSVGKLGLQDWYQISTTAGVGNSRMRQELVKSALAAGTLHKVNGVLYDSQKHVVDAQSNFNKTLSDGWANGEVITKTLQRYADTNTTLGKKAFKAAQQVRTFTDLIGTFREALGSGWQSVFQALFGNMKKSTQFWTGLSNAMGNATGAFFNFATTTLRTWRKMGGFEKTIQGIKNILAPFGAILKAIGTAWNEAFPSKGGKGPGKALYSMSSGFEAATRPLQTLAKLITSLTPVLATFFRIIAIGVGAIKTGARIIGNFVGHIVDLAKMKAPSSGGFIRFVRDLAKAIGSAVKQVDDLLSKGKSLSEAFGSVHINLPSLPKFKMPSLGGLFGGGGEDKKQQSQLRTLAGGMKDLTKNVLGLNDASDKVEGHMFFNPKAKLDSSRVQDLDQKFRGLASDVTKSGDGVATVGDKMGGVFSTLKAKLSDFIKNFNGQDLMGAFNLAVLSTFVISVSRFFNTLTKSFQGFVGIGEGVNGVLESAGSALKSFQTQARAKMILNIAIALGILAAALWVLSKIPANQLGKALTGLAGIMLIMGLTLKAMTDAVEKLDGKNVSIRLIALSIAIGALAAAMLLLAIAFKIMDHTGIDGVLKGLATIVVVMKSFEGLGKLAEKSYKNIVGASIAIALVSGSMVVLAGALLLFNLVKWESMGKAGAALGGLSLAVGALALIPYQGIAKVGVALLTASAGMLAIANALIIFGAVKWESIGKAAVMLGALTIALAALMFVGNPMSIAGMFSMGAAMIAIATAALIMNKVDWSSIAKVGVIMLGLVVAFAAFVAIAYLAAPVLILLSAFAGSLALLAFAIAALGAAFAIVFPLLAAGTAAFAAFATGAAIAIAVFLQTLAAEAPSMSKAFLDILQVLIDTIVKAVPMIIDGIKRLWAAVKAEFTSKDKNTLMGQSGKSWIDRLKEGVESKIGDLVDAAKNLIIRFLKGLASHGKEIGSGAAKLIAQLLEGISRHSGEIVKGATDCITSFIRGVGQNAPRIADAGAKAIIDFINGMAESIRSNGPQLVEAFGNLGVAMVQGLIGGIGRMAGDAMSAIGGLAQGMVNKAKGILKIFSPSRVFRDIGKFLVQGLTNGIQDNASSAITAVASMVSGQIATASSYISKFVQDLDQKAIAAKAKADGLAAAAQKAADEANKTKKNKKDDKAAEKLQKQADKAQKAADAAQAKSDAAKAASDRADQFRQASTLEKAQMRSEDAQNQLDAAKAQEAKAARELQEADALDKQAKKDGLSKAERKRLRDQADALRAQAKKDAQDANNQLDNARQSAADALSYQKQAGDEAAAAFQAMFDADAKAAADAEAFDKLSDADKAEARRKQAAELQAKAQQDLDAAKRLAYTDLDGANELADQARQEADQARQYLEDAQQYDEQAKQGTGIQPGTVVDLTPTELAAEAFNRYMDLYDSSTAAAAATPTVEFNQYNTSPEALSPSEVYRQTNNLVTFAAGKLVGATP